MSPSSPAHDRLTLLAASLCLLFGLSVLSIPISVAAQELPSPTGGGPTPLLFLHPLVNYREDPTWVRDWERSLQSNNNLRANVGSVSTDDFLTEIEFHLTEPIGSGFRVLYDMNWFEGAHVEILGQQHFLGFEFAVASPLGLQLQVHPTSRKEELDLRAGLLLHDSIRAQYLRVLLRWDDFLFEKKNDQGGVSDQIARSVEWTGRGKLGAIEIFSRGHYGSAEERSYPDSLLSPETLADSEYLGGSSTRLRAVAASERFLELELLHYEYEQSETPRATGTRNQYRNRVLDLVLRGVWNLNPRWRVRGELHRLEQSASGCGESYIDYDRDDWMPAVFLRWSLHRVHRFELGYLATAYRWTGDPGQGANPDQDGYAQKIKLGWIVEFSPRALLQISLSHEPDPQRFGGGNVQLMLKF